MNGDERGRMRRETRYGGLSIALHWLMLLLIALVYATMEFKTAFPKGSAQRDAMATWHYMLGLSVFFLAWLRLLARVTGPNPAVVPAMPKWPAALAGTTHASLYALMLGLPLLGWLTLSAKGTPVPFFGAVLPALLEKSESLARRLKDIHETLATAGYFIIGLHAAAALYHHYVRRDNTLRLMSIGRAAAG
jgi:cytochrome b561